MVVFLWFRLWAPLGALLGPSWLILWVSGWPLAPPWGPLGTCLAYLGASWCLLGSVWDLVGASWWLLAPPWESLGTRLAYLGASWCLLGPPWDLVGVCWWLLAPPWEFLGTCLAHPFGGLGLAVQFAVGQALAGRLHFVVY